MNATSVPTATDIRLLGNPCCHLCPCCGTHRRATVRVWASEVVGMPADLRRRAPESVMLCPDCAARAKGEAVPVPVSVERLPPNDPDAVRWGAIAGKYSGNIRRMLAGTPSRILRMLSEGQDRDAIARALRMSRGEVSSRICTMRSLGLVDEAGRLTEAGLARVAMVQAAAAAVGGAQ